MMAAAANTNGPSRKSHWPASHDAAHAARGARSRAWQRHLVQPAAPVRRQEAGPSLPGPLCAIRAYVQYVASTSTSAALYGLWSTVPARYEEPQVGVVLRRHQVRLGCTAMRLRPAGNKPNVGHANNSSSRTSAATSGRLPACSRASARWSGAKYVPTVHSLRHRAVENPQSSPPPDETGARPMMRWGRGPSAPPKPSNTQRT